MKLFTKDVQEAPKSERALYLERCALDEVARRGNVVGDDRVLAIAKALNQSPMLRHVVEAERAAAILKRREIIETQSAERRAAYQRREMAEIRYAKLQQEFERIEAQYKQASAVMAAAFGESMGASSRASRYGPLGLGGRELTCLADERIKDLRSWVAGLDHAISDCHHVTSEAIGRAWSSRPILERVWNTDLICSARAKIRALVEECDQLLTSDYGAELFEQLVSIRERAWRVVDHPTLLEAYPDRFTFHTIPD